MKTNIFKTISIAFFAAMFLMGCQKEQPVDNGNDNEVATVKYATRITDGSDHRDLGTPADWMEESGSLSFLKASKNLHNNTDMPGIFDNVPTGIFVTQESFVYATFVGNSANFNNVLGYYYYNVQDMPQDPEEARGFILTRIFQSNNAGLTFNNVIYHRTKNLEFGYTFQLSDENGRPFQTGTMIGFYLLPNSGSDMVTYFDGTKQVSLPKVKMNGNVPHFIATDYSVNKDEAVSHVVGQSACGDMVIAFEDLNSDYSGSSDEDFNDLVFLVGDNLQTRSTDKIVTSQGFQPFELETMGDVCFRCLEADMELSALTNNIMHKNENQYADHREIYEPVFDAKEYVTGYLPIMESTPLYARITWADCDYYTTVGWFEYEGQNFNKSDIEAQIITVKGNGVRYIKEEHIIFKNITGQNTGGSEIVQLGASVQKAFASGKNIGFFFISYLSGPQADIRYDGNDNGNPYAVRFSNYRPKGNQGEDQGVYIVKSACNNILLAFEDTKNGDGDYNDVIINISDNNRTFATSKVDVSKMYSLDELNKAYNAKYGK